MQIKPSWAQMRMEAPMASESRLGINATLICRELCALWQSYTFQELGTIDVHLLDSTDDNSIYPGRIHIKVSRNGKVALLDIDARDLHWSLHDFSRSHCENLIQQLIGPDYWLCLMATAYSKGDS